MYNLLLQTAPLPTESAVERVDIPRKVILNKGTCVRIKTIKQLKMKLCFRFCTIQDVLSHDTTTDA